MIPYRDPIIHSDSPSVYPSPYDITDDALQRYEVSRELFGTTTVLLSDKSFVVRDYQYDVSDRTGSTEPVPGMYFLPVDDYGDVVSPDGSRLPGYAVIDGFLRKEMGLSESDQIFVLISYMHPELNKGTVQQLASGDKVQLGCTHMGAYTGKNMTTNSPEFYHDNRWMVTGLLYANYGYPANVHMVSLKGVPQNILNLNLFLTDMMLNHGVQFPGDYENSAFEPVYLNAALMVYRDWLFDADYLRNNTRWFFYCAAHKTVMINIALNLPHNPQAFMEVYGTEAGAALYSKFKDKYRNATGFLFPDSMQTDFTPLWKLQGLTPGQIVPFTIEQFNEYDRHRRNGTPYTGPVPVWPPLGVAWGPQTTADIIFDFVQIYADLLDAGAIVTCSVIYGFMPAVETRTGISAEQYLYYAIPFIQKLIYADARQFAALNPVQDWKDSLYYKTQYMTLRYIFGGDAPSETTRFPTGEAAAFSGTLEELVKSDPTPDQLADAALAMVRDKWAQLMAAGCVDDVTAYVEFMECAREDMDRARAMIVTDPDKIEFNTPPAIVEMIARGMFPKSEFVNVRTVCTAVDMSELQLKKKK